MNIDFPSKNQKSSFGELSVEYKTPKVNQMFQYGISTKFWHLNSTAAASITQSDGKAVVQTGASADSFSQLVSKEVLKYVPGIGGVILFTAFFTTGVSGSEQVVGLGDQEDGFFFGFNGDTFGVLRRQGGQRDIHEITISAGASSTGNITITLNGSAVVVAVTSGDSISDVVTKIVAAGFPDIGWNAFRVDNTAVQFISMDASTHAGAFTFADTDSTGVTASAFTEIVSGAVATDTWVAQTSWNIDKMDGSGFSKQTLDVTKGNVYKIQYQWLGFGAIVFSLENSDTGMLQEVHRITYANSNTIPSINNPTLPFSYSVKNVANTSNLKVEGASVGLFLEGVNEIKGLPSSISGSLGSVGASQLNLLTIRNKLIFKGKINRVSIDATFLSVGIDNVKGAILSLVKNADVAGSVAWQDVDSDNSVVEYDVGGAAVTGTSFFSVLVPKDTSDTVPLKDLNIELQPGESLTLAVASSGGTGAFDAILNWLEQF